MKKRPRDLARLAGNFVREYGRKAQSGEEPNDRKYDRRVEAALKRLAPAELGDVLRGDREPAARPRGRPRP